MSKVVSLADERIYLLNSVDKIIFITKWVKKKFFEGLPSLSDNKTQIIYHSIDPFKKKIKKNKQIIFVGKLNESKGYDLYCKAMFKILDSNKDWRAYSIGEEKRFQNFPTHSRHKSLGQISQWDHNPSPTMSWLASLVAPPQTLLQVVLRSSY